MYDVVIIGAGPAGTVAARRLAEAGRSVVLLEEHESVGQPVHCTGLLGLEAFDEFDLPQSLVLGRSGAARFWGAAGESVLVQSAHVHAAVIDRAALDQELARRAVAAGVELRRGYRVGQVTVGRRAVEVRGANGDHRVEGRACVLACGANYRFHRALGFGLPAVFLQSAQLETPFPAVAEVEVKFGREVAPDGFAWVVPFSRGETSYARVGLMSADRARDRFRSFVGTFAARVGVSEADLPAPRYKMLPLGPVTRTYGDRVLAVGDAAGLVKPTTGGGIYYGMLSGTYAAEALEEGLGRDRLTAGALRGYEGRWRRALGSEIKMGLRFRRVASRLSDHSIDALIDLARVNGIVPILEKNASFNWHRKAAMALLAHPAFRRIAVDSWARGR